MIVSWSNWLVLTRVDSCWFVLTCVGLVLIRVDLCWYSCIRIDLIDFHCQKTSFSVNTIFVIDKKYAQWSLDIKAKVFHESILCFMKCPWNRISWMLWKKNLTVYPSLNKHTLFTLGVTFLKKKNFQINRGPYNILLNMSLYKRGHFS